MTVNFFYNTLDKLNYTFSSFNRLLESFKISWPFYLIFVAHFSENFLTIICFYSKTICLQHLNVMSLDTHSFAELHAKNSSYFHLFTLNFIFFSSQKCLHLVGVTYFLLRDFIYFCNCKIWKTNYLFIESSKIFLL